MLGSSSAALAFQQRSGSHESDEEFACEERSWTRWRRMGDRRGSNAGGGRGEAKAVGRQARSGGNRTLVSGGGMNCTIVKG